VDCKTYSEKYLSAHVDGELSAAELREVEEHLAGCVNCRARFAEERAVKALVRERAAMRRTPAMVRGSILAALDAVDAAGASKALKKITEPEPQISNTKLHHFKDLKHQYKTQNNPILKQYKKLKKNK